MSPVIRWWLVRHAPVPGGIITGRLDVDCDTSDGQALARLAARLPVPTGLIESGLRRCRQTAAALAGPTWPAPLVEPDLAEQDFGSWAGRCWADLADDSAAEIFWQFPADTAPPGGESFAALVTRVGAALDRLERRYEDGGGDLVAMLHAGTIRAALARALDLPPAAALRFAVDPLSLTRIDRVQGAWRVVGVNLG